MKFEWNPRKAKANLRKHKVSLSEAATEKIMKKRKNKTNDDLRPEYDLRELLKGAVRGKYAKPYHEGTNLVLLEPDIRKVFRSEAAVNEALRLVIKLRAIGTRK